MENLNPAVSITLADAVEKKIYQYISRNKMQPGDSLPKEEELSNVLKVSRSIVREAMSRLRMLGLVETRKKKGMTIAQPDAFIGLEKMVSTGVMSEEYRKDLLEMRVILELGMTDYIFYNKTNSDTKELEAIVKKENLKKITLYELNQLDMAFHSKLYDISGNKVLKHLEVILKPVFRNIYDDAEKSSKTISTGHKEICNILRCGTADEFREVMRKHLSVYMKFEIK